MPEFEAPQGRNEAALQNILGAGNQLEPAQGRAEKILHAILGEEIPLDRPQSRIEELLLKLYEVGLGVHLDSLAYGATAAEIVNGKEAYNDQGVKIVGTLVVPIYADGNEVAY